MGKTKLLALVLAGSMAVTQIPFPEGILAAEDSGRSVKTASVSAWQSGDQVYNAYIRSLFYGKPKGKSKVTKKAASVKSRLNTGEQWLYGKLAEFVKKVAAGEEKKTEITIEDFEGSGLKTSWSASELKSSDKDQIAKWVSGQVESQINFKKVWNCLQADLPYEFYWHDKSSSGGLSDSISCTMETDGTSIVNANVGQITIGFAVNKKYAKSNGISHEMSENIAELSQQAKAAAENAKAIVTANQKNSDYEKLKAYKNQICTLVSYNQKAASNTSSYSDDNNPWQLVYVFDNDPDTNVVCEGYSKAFKYLCDQTDFTSNKIACYDVTGTMSGGPHMWNIVTMNDSGNYLVDVTNCDEGTVGEEDKLFLAALPGDVSSGYTFQRDIKSILYTYDEDTKTLYGTDSGSVLHLKKTDAAGNYEASAEPEVKNLKESAVTLAPVSFTYNGQKQQPEVSVDGRPAEESAFSVAITSGDSEGQSAGVNAGTVTVTVTAKEGSGYTGSVSKTYQIEKATPSVSDVVCTNSDSLLVSMKPEEVLLSGKAVREQTAVEGSFALLDTALLAGTNTYHFKFIPKDTRNYNEVTDSIQLMILDNTQKNPLSIVPVTGKTYGDAAFQLSATGGVTGGKVTFGAAANNGVVTVSESGLVTIVHAGKAVITAEDSAGTKASYELTIAQKKAKIQWSGNGEYAYNGSEQGVSASVANAGNDKVELTVTGNKGKDSGTYTARVTGISNKDYTIEGADNLTKEWKITGKDIAGASVTLGTALVYNGKEQEQTVSSVTLNGQAVTYQLSGNRATAAGSHNLTVTGTGAYSGSITTAYTIAKADAQITLGNLSQTEGSTSGVTATLSPQSSDAKVTLEYQVGAEGKENWVTQFPTKEGTYKVRAYLNSKDAGNNLNGYSDYATAEKANHAASGELKIAKKTTGNNGSISTEIKPDGTVVRTEKNLQSDGTAATLVTEIDPSGNMKMTTTIADSNGKTISVTEKSTIQDAGNGNSAVVTVQKDGAGKILSSRAEVTVSGNDGIAVLSGKVSENIGKAAGTSTEISMTVTGENGQKAYTVHADTADLVAGNKLKVFALGKKNSYTLVNAKTYTVSTDGSLGMQLADSAEYRFMNTADAGQVESQILKTVKAARTSVKVRPYMKGKILSNSFNRKNAKSISYSSSNRRVVWVSADGVAHTRKKGKAVVCARVVLKNGKKKTVKVKITVR